MSSQPIRWRVPADADLRWRSWDGEHVLYHGASGDTHHMGAVAAETLRVLGARPMTAPELTRHLETSAGTDGIEEFARSVEAMLGRLDELGLIETAP